MISKPVEAQIIGRSKTIPEGIFGAVDMPEDNSNPQTSKKKKFVQIGEHRVELTDMIPISIKVKGKTVKKKKKLGKPKIKTVTLERPAEKKKKKKQSVMPAIEINYDGSGLPPEAEGLNLDNVVSIPEEVLKRVVRTTETRTKRLSKLMLNSVTPSMLSYDAASNYVKAVLSDGLKIDVEVDRGVLEVVKELSRLDVVHFYLKRLSLPKALKEHYMRVFIDEMAKSSIESMKKADKSESQSSMLREMQAVVMKRSEHQTAEQTKEKAQQRLGGTAVTKRSRKDKPVSNIPLAGGF